MNKYFKIFSYTEPRKVDIAVGNFKGTAANWWRELERNMATFALPEVLTWEQLTRSMDTAFISVTYDRDVKIKLQQLTQGSRSVAEYFNELNNLSFKAKITEDDNAKQARFLFGLKQSIRHQLSLFNFPNVFELFQKAVIVEEQMVEKCFSKQTFSKSVSKPTSSTKPAPFFKKTYNNPIFKKPFELKTQETTKGDSSKKPVVKTSQIECFKCRGRGHYALSCPNNRVMVIKEDDVDSASEGDISKGEEAVEVTA